MNEKHENPETINRRNFLELTGGLTAGALLASAGSAFSADKAGDRKIRMGVVGGGFGSTFQWHSIPTAS